MVSFRTDDQAVMGLGDRIVAMAGRLGCSPEVVSKAADVDRPPRTTEALGEFTKRYGYSTTRLRDDVIALGRLTQAAGAEYGRVEAAAAQLWAAERTSNEEAVESVTARLGAADRADNSQGARSENRGPDGRR